MAETGLTPEQFNAILDMPALTPPPGHVSNFVDPYTIVGLDWALFGVALAVPTIVVALRLYSKIFVVRDPGRDDYLLVAGWVFYIVYCTLIGTLGTMGIGRHQYDIQVRDVFRMLHTIHAPTIIYAPATVFIKASILLQFLKIFSPPGTRNFMFWSCWGLIAFLVAYYLPGMLAGIFACTPIKKFWLLYVPGRCIDYRALNVVSGVVNTLSDLIIIILPQRAIWKLKIPLRKKLRVCCIFLIGLFALAASIVRLVYGIQLLTAPDQLWIVNLVGLWSFAEFITTFICACLPSLAQLTSVWLPQLRAMSKKFKFPHIYSSGVATTTRASTDSNKTYVQVRVTDRKDVSGETDRCSTPATLPEMIAVGPDLTAALDETWERASLIPV